MNKKLENAKRLICALERYSDDSVAIQYIAKALNYDLNQLKIDIKDVSVIYDLLKDKE